METLGFMENDEDTLFIQRYISDKFNAEYSAEDINIIVDLIYEFYGEIGLFGGSESHSPKDTAIDREKEVSFIKKNLDEYGRNNLTETEITHIIEAELAYCESADLL